MENNEPRKSERRRAPAARETQAEREATSEPSDKNFLPVSILIAAVLISGSILYAATRPGGLGAPSGGTAGTGNAAPSDVPTAADTSKVLQIGDRDVILGDPNAPVTFIEYGDFQCPFCGRFFTDVQPKIESDYVKTGKVKMVYRDLAFLGPESVSSAQAAECAKDQGKFWAYHDALFTTEVKDGQENSGNLTRDVFVKLATDLGMDVAKFTQCFDSQQYADVITQVTNDAHAAGVNATPTSFVNGKILQGALPYDQFKAAIDAALN
jgi:protein-disulfide isomerase